MEKMYKELIEKAEKNVEALEEKVEDLSEDFTEEGGELWDDLKKRLKRIENKLKDAYAQFEGETELKAHLSMMEARDVLEDIRDSAESFLYTVSKNTAQEFDMAEIKAHLAKMDTEDTLEEKQKELSHLYATSKVDVERLSKKAGEEINDIIVKLTQVV